VPLHRCGGVIHAHQKPSRHVLDAYALNVRQNQFTKAYPAKHVLSKVEGTLSSQRNYLLIIRTWRTLRLCASGLIPTQIETKISNIFGRTFSRANCKGARSYPIESCAGTDPRYRRS
jgi:hypothetical protein